MALEGYRMKNIEIRSQKRQGKNFVSINPSRRGITYELHNWTASHLDRNGELLSGLMRNSLSGRRGEVG